MICENCGKPARKRWFLTESQKAKIVKLSKAGYSGRDIETKTGFSHSTVTRLLQKLRASK